MSVKKNDPVIQLLEKKKNQNKTSPTSSTANGIDNSKIGAETLGKDYQALLNKLKQHQQTAESGAYINGNEFDGLTSEIADLQKRLKAYYRRLQYYGKNNTQEGQQISATLNDLNSFTKNLTEDKNFYGQYDEESWKDYQDFLTKAEKAKDYNIDENQAYLEELKANMENGGIENYDVNKAIYEEAKKKHGEMVKIKNQLDEQEKLKGAQNYDTKAGQSRLDELLNQIKEWDAKSKEHEAKLAEAKRKKEQATTPEEKAYWQKQYNQLSAQSKGVNSASSQALAAKAAYNEAKRLHEENVALKQKALRLQKYADIPNAQDWLEKSATTNTKWYDYSKSGLAADAINNKGKDNLLDVYDAILNNRGAIAGYTSITAPTISAILPFLSTQGRDARDRYEQMTDEQKRIFNYLYNTDGGDAAMQYLKDIDTELAVKYAKKRKSSIDEGIKKAVGRVPGNWAEGIVEAPVYAFESYVGGLEEAIPNLKAGLFNKEKPIANSEYVNQALTEDSNPVTKALVEVGQSIGNMTPSIIIGTALQAVGVPTGLASAIGAAEMGFQARGSAYSDAIRQGYSKKEASLYATANGALEASLQYALGGIGGASSRVLSKLGVNGVAKLIPTLGKSVAGIESGILRALATFPIAFVADAGSEALEEGLQAFLDPYVRHFLLEGGDWSDIGDVKVNWEEVGYSAMLGAITSGIMSGANLLSDSFTLPEVTKQYIEQTYDTDKDAPGRFSTISHNLELETSAIFKLAADAVEKGDTKAAIKLITQAENLTAYTQSYMQQQGYEGKIVNSRNQFEALKSRIRDGSFNTATAQTTLREGTDVWKTVAEKTDAVAHVLLNDALSNKVIEDSLLKDDSLFPYFKNLTGVNLYSYSKISEKRNAVKLAAESYKTFSESEAAKTAQAYLEANTTEKNGATRTENRIKAMSALNDEVSKLKAEATNLRNTKPDGYKQEVQKLDSLIRMIINTVTNIRNHNNMALASRDGSVVINNTSKATKEKGATSENTESVNVSSVTPAENDLQTAWENLSDEMRDMYDIVGEKGTTVNGETKILTEQDVNELNREAIGRAIAKKKEQITNLSKEINKTKSASKREALIKERGEARQELKALEAQRDSLEEYIGIKGLAVKEKAESVRGVAETIIQERITALNKYLGKYGVDIAYEMGGTWYVDTDGNLLSEDAATEAIKKGKTVFKRTNNGEATDWTVKIMSALAEGSVPVFTNGNLRYLKVGTQISVEQAVDIIIGHELVHFVKNNASKQSQDLYKKIINNIKGTSYDVYEIGNRMAGLDVSEEADKKWNALKNLYADTIVNNSDGEVSKAEAMAMVDEDYIYEEIAANYMGSLMASEGVIDTITETLPTMQKIMMSFSFKKKKDGLKREAARVDKLANALLEASNRVHGREQDLTLKRAEMRLGKANETVERMTQKVQEAEEKLKTAEDELKKNNTAYYRDRVEKAKDNFLEAQENEALAKKEAQKAKTQEENAKKLLSAETKATGTKTKGSKMSVTEGRGYDGYIPPTESIRFNVGVVDAHKESLANKITSDSSVGLDTLMARYDKILEIWDRLGGELNSEFLNEWNSKTKQDRVFTVFKAQTGYKYNIELSSMCKKGVPLFEAIDEIVRKEIMKDLGIKTLGKAEKELLYDILSNKGFDIPCAICYVEQARQREGDIINAFLDGNNDGKLGWNQVLENIEKEMANNGVEYSFKVVGRDIATDVYTPESIVMDGATQDAFYSAWQKLANEEITRYNEETKAKKLKRNIRPLIKEITPNSIKNSLGGSAPANLKIFKVLYEEQNSRMKLEHDLLQSSMSTANLKGRHSRLYSLFNQQGGASGFKTKQTPVIYAGDILEKRWKASDLRISGGARNQSNSDSQMYTLIDQVQMYIDFTAKGYYMQAYTKVLSEIKLFGLSNSKINASLIPKVKVYYLPDGKTVDVARTMETAGLDENGEPLYDDIEGINHDEAFMLIEDPEYSKSVGGICIGYSDKHIFRLLDDPRIQLIIGFHDKTDDPDARYRGAKYSKNYNGENEAVKHNPDGTTETVHIGFNQFVLKAEKMFSFDKQTETYSGTTTFNGRTYTANDIPRLAADLYLDMCAKKNYTPAYNTFKGHKNYYKLLADFSLYDSEGNYAPQKKVAYNMPDQVPYLENGKKKYLDSEKYIKKELEKELSVRADVSEALADTSEDGIIPQFIAAVKKMQGKKSDSKRSVTPEEDAEYLEAVERGDMKTARKMVEKAARANGYNSPMLFHGTGTFGFTKFDLGKMDDGISIFTTNDKRIAETYSGKTQRHKISDRVVEDIDNMPDADLLPIVQRYIDEAYHIATKKERVAMSEKLVDSFTEAFSDLMKFISDNEDSFNQEKTDIVLSIGEDIRNMAFTDDESVLFDLFRDYEDKMWDLKFLDDSIGTEIAKLVNQSVIEAYRVADETLSTDTLFVKKNPDGSIGYLLPNEAREYAWKHLYTGIYSLYGNTDNFFEIDAGGSNWNQIDGANIGKQGNVATRDVAKFAKDNNYNGVIIKNVKDAGSAANYVGVSDVYVFFDNTALKSADPVTYDDNGNVIPLSERFNPENDDIRYSVSETEETDSRGKRLTTEQVEFFKDSKIRDRRGDLLRVYHATNADFTIFDKAKIGGKNGALFGRGFYFSKDESQAVRYGRNVGEFYLNIKKPFDYLNFKKKDVVRILDASGYEYDKRRVNYFDYDDVEDVDLISDLLEDALTDVDVYATFSDMVQKAGYDGIVAGREIIAFEPEQIKRTDNKNPTSDPDVRYSVSEVDETIKAPVFYSKMGKVIDGVKQTKMGAKDVINYLTDRKRGVKDEEIKWSGIEAFLEGKKSVTKKELQEFVAGSMLFVEENTLDDRDVPLTIAETNKISKLEEERTPLVSKIKELWRNTYGSRMPDVNWGAGVEYAVNHLIVEEEGKLSTNSKRGADLQTAKERLEKEVAINREYLYQELEGESLLAQPTDRDLLRYILLNPGRAIQVINVVLERNSVKTNGDLTATLMSLKSAIEPIAGLANEYKQTRYETPSNVRKEFDFLLNKVQSINNEIGAIKQAHYNKVAKTHSKWSEYTLDGGENYRELVFKMPNSSYTNEAMKTHWGEDAEGVLAHARIQDFETTDGKKMLFVEEIQSDWHNAGQKNGYVDKSKKHSYEVRFEAQPLTGKKVVRLYRDGEATPHFNYTEDAEIYDSVIDDWRERTEDEYLEGLMKVEKAGLEEVPDAPFRNNYHEYVIKRLLRMAAEEGYDSIGWTTADLQMQRWNPDRSTNEDMGITDAKNPDAVAFEEGYRIEYDQDIPSFLKRYGKKWGAKVETANIGEGIEVWSMDITDSMKNSVLYEGQEMYSVTEEVVGGENYAALAESLEKNKANTEKLINAMIKNGKGEYDVKTVPQFIRDVRKAYGSKDSTGVNNAYSDAYQYVYNKKLRTVENGKSVWKKVDKVDPETAREMFRNVAKEIFDSSVEDDRASLLREIRKIKISVPNEVKMTFENWNKFRMSNFGRLSLVKDGVTIGEAYAKLNEIAPELFPDSITDPVEQLNTISNEATNLRNEIESEEYTTAEMDTIEAITAELIGGTMALDPSAKHLYETLAETRQYYRERIENIKASKDAWWQDVMGEKLRNKDERYRLHYEKGINQKLVKDLTTRLYKPTTDKHIPESMRGDIAYILGGLKLPDKPKAYKELKTIIKNVVANGEFDEATFDKFPEGFEKTVNEVHQVDFENMDSVTAHELNQFLRSVMHYINLEDSLFHSSESASYAAALATEQINLSTKNNKIVNGFIQKVDDLWMSAYDAEGLFNYVGVDELYRAYQEIAKGQDTFASSVSKYTDLMSKVLKENGLNEGVPKEWHTKKIAFSLDGSKKPLLLTQAELMSLYLLEKQEDSRNRLLNIGGGIETLKQGDKEVEETVNGKTKKVTRKGYVVAGSFKLTEHDLYNKILPELDPVAKKVADGISAILNGEIATDLNQTSLVVDGYKKFNVKNYFPESVSDTVKKVGLLDKEIEALMTGKSFTKDRTGSKGVPLKINDIFEVYDRHILGASQYIGYEKALRDFNKIYNGTYNGKRLSNAIQNKMGVKTTNAIENFIRSVQGRQMNTRDDQQLPLEKMFGNYKAAKVMLNASVVMKQPTAIFRAIPEFSKEGRMAIVQGAKDVTKDLATNTLHPKEWLKLEANRELMDEMIAHSGLAKMKSWGFSEYANAKTVGQLYDKNSMSWLDKLNEKRVFNWAEMADLITWSIIWKACKAETNTLEEATDKFNDVIRKTQVVESATTSSPIAKSNFYTKIVFAFKNEPLKTLNYIRACLKDVVRGKEGAGNHLAKALAWTGLSIALTSAITTAFSLGRDDEDDDILGNKDWWKVIGNEYNENFWWDVFGTATVFLGDIIPAVESALRGREVERADTALVTDTVNLLMRLYKGNYAAPIFGKDSAKKTGLSLFYDASDVVSTITGLPIRTVMRDTKAIAKNTLALFDDPNADYFYDKQFYTVKGNKARYKDILTEALDRSYEDYTYIKNDLVKRGYTQTDIDNAVKNSDRFVTAWNDSPEAFRKELNEAQKLDKMFSSDYVIKMMDKRRSDIVGDLFELMMKGEKITAAEKKTAAEKREEILNFRDPKTKRPTTEKTLNELLEDKAMSKMRTDVNNIVLTSDLDIDKKLEEIFKRYEKFGVKLSDVKKVAREKDKL